jgi:LysM repeat protein
MFIFGSLLPPYTPPSTLVSPDMALMTTQVLLVEEGFLMKSSSLSRQGKRRAYAEGIVHTVREGENLERIARRYDISVDTIVWSNDIDRNIPIQPGDELLVLPVDGVIHAVRPGQTLSRIAQLYSVTMEEIAEQNRLKGGFILAGQELIIPNGSPIIHKQPVTPTVVVDDTPKADLPPLKKPPEEPVPTALAYETQGVFQRPCNNCFYTQYYNPGHYAVDLQTRGGGPVFAAEDGTVIRADRGWNGGFGNVIEVDHGNGLVTLYAHNSKHFVTEGQRVNRGQLIAWMGNTGRTYGSTGIHVHFEVRVNGVKRNPLLYLQ